MKRAFVSWVALSLGLGALMGCHGDDPVSKVAEPVASASAADTAAAPTKPGAGDVFAIAGSQLEQGGATGGPWAAVGDAYGVTAMAGFHGSLYVASNNQLWRRGAIGAGSGNDWTLDGQANGAIAMTYHQGQLYMIAGNQLWQRSAIGAGTDWSYAGDAYGVTAMASYGGHLYVISGNALWQRGAIGPGTGNDWSYAGDAYGVTAMAEIGGHLYVVSNNGLWQRGAIGPGTGNDWSSAGAATGITVLASIPVVCDQGLSSADCPPGDGVDLYGLTNVAQQHPATQSSTLGAAPPSLAVDRDVTTAAVTAVEASPWWSVDLGFDRPVEALSVSTDATSAVVELLDSSGTVVGTQPLSAFATAQGFRVVAFDPVVARSVRVRSTASAQGGTSLRIWEVQAFARLLPVGFYPPPPPPDGVCWKNTYGRGAGTPITACDADQDKDGALCYPECAPGYYGVGPVCWQSCPAGWTDTGAFCHLDGSIISADNSGCPWYDECGLTFAPGCSTCPAGYANDGCTCLINSQDFAKSSYGRGAGVPLHCTDAQEEQAALCYTPCSPGFDGEGPACWGECAGDYGYDCLLSCATSESACTDFITTVTMDTANMMINLSQMVESFGESFEAVTEARAVAAALGDDQVQALKDSIAEQLMSQGEDLATGAAQNTAGLVVNGMITGQIDWTQLDPTGIAAVVLVFNQSLCN